MFCWQVLAGHQESNRNRKETREQKIGFREKKPARKQQKGIHDPKLQISRVKREPFATHSGNQVAPPAEEGVTFKFNKYLGGFETYKYMFNIV